MINYKKLLLLAIVASLIVFQTSCSTKVSAEKVTAIQAKVIGYLGDPLIVNKDNPDGVKVFDNMSIIEGDKIVTGLNERVSILIKDSTEVIIDENSEIMIDELRAENGGDNQSLSIIKGKVWSNLKEKLNVDSKYEIKTPTAVMGVRGTKFITSYIDNTNKVVVDSGIVSVRLNKSEKEHLVNALEQVEFSDSAEDEDIVVEKTNPDILDDFDKEMINYVAKTDVLNQTNKTGTEKIPLKTDLENKDNKDNNEVKPIIIKENINQTKDIVVKPIEDNKDIETIGETNNVDEVKDPVIEFDWDVDAATKAVIKAEFLRTETSIITANTLISKLVESETKNSLKLRVEILIAKLAVEKAEYLKNQESVTQALVLVNNLPESAEKSDLIVRLENIQIIINVANSSSSSSSSSSGSSSTGGSSTDSTEEDDGSIAIANATSKVVAAEQAVDTDHDLSTQLLINNAQTLYNAAKTAVDSLIPTNSDLVTRLNDVLGTINNAQNTLVASATDKVALAEGAAGHLSTQELINEATNLYTDAKNLVDTLTTTEKVSLSATLSGVKDDIDNAQDLLDAVTDAVTDATNKVVLAENADDNLSSQSLVESASALYNIAAAVLDLDDLDAKISLTSRLDVVIINIDAAQYVLDVAAAENKVILAEAADDGSLIKQGEINIAMDIYDTAFEAVDALLDSTEKDALIIRLDVVKTNIEVAQDIYDAVVFATSKVKKAEESTVSLTTTTLIDNATTLYNSATTVVEALTDSTEKTSLIIRLDAVESKINDAIVVYAENKVVLAENAAKSLINQSLVDNAKVLYNDATEVVIELEGSDEKLNLTGKLDVVLNNINDAQSVLNIAAATAKVILAENADNDLSSQSLIDNANTVYNTASAAVEDLEDSTEKTDLQVRLNLVKNNIDSAQDILDAIEDATAKVELAEQAIIDSSDSDSINNAKDLYDVAKADVELLDELPEKTILLSRLAVIKNNIDNAQYTFDAITDATNKVVLAENADDLSTQSLINNAQSLYDTAKLAVDSLDPTNVDLVTRLNNVLGTINNAQNELVASATEMVALAEGATGHLSTQELIDEATNLYTDAKKLVDTLSSTEKESLSERLSVVKDDIYNAQEFLNDYLAALDQVVLAENATDDLSTQIKIDNAETLYAEANISVEALDDSDEKDELSSRLVDVKNSIDMARIDLATVAVVNAETNQTQDSVDSAQVLVSNLDEAAEKVALQTRIDVVQLIIDTINQPIYIKSAGELVDEAESLIKIAQSKIDAFEKKGTSTLKTTAIDSISTAFAKIDEALETIKKIKDDSKSDDKLDKLIDWSIKLVATAMRDDDDDHYFLGNDVVNDCESKAREVIAEYSPGEKKQDYKDDLADVLSDD